MIRYYKCPKCGEVKYWHGSMSDPILETCPECKSEPVTQKLDLNFKLNGSDWYSPDAGKMNNGG